MDKKRELVNNSIILLIGKFMTQFITIILLPLYTRFLITSEYGMVDLLQTYITLLLPILTLKIDSAVFRFLVEKRNDEESKIIIISNAIFVLLLTIIISVLLLTIMNELITIKYFSYFAVNVIIMMISSVALQILRGLGKNKEFSISSVLTGLTILILNILLILIFNFGAESIFIATSIGNIFCIVYICIITKINKYINKNYVRKDTIKELIKYSLPMIPNSLSWWIVNVSDRTIISVFMGAAYNGIYTISCKLSNIINSIFNIINMSWQETASLHIDDDDKDIFFSEAINKIYSIFASISILLLGILPLTYNILIGKNYISAYNYIPILLYSNTWSVLINLIGGIYIGKKKTKEIANTTIISSLINIIINVALIKKIGLYAACISTLISYIVMVVYRYYDCKKYVKLELDFIRIISYSIIFAICSFFYYKGSYFIQFIVLAIIFGYVCYLNHQEIKMIIKKIFRKKDRNI